MFWKHFIRITIAIILAGCGGNPLENDQDYSSLEGTDMLSLVNSARSRGAICGSDSMPPVAALRWSTKLENAADLHAEDMRGNQFFDHEGSNGSQVSSRVSRQNYRWRAVGENIARGQNSVRSVVIDWMKSEGHCRNIMGAKFSEIGASRSGTYWVQVFAAPQ